MLTVWATMALFGGALYIAWEANERTDSEKYDPGFKTKEDMYDDE